MYSREEKEMQRLGWEGKRQLHRWA